ncbi:acyltransferase family protein [Brachybacterium phenoliresistens]|uniref:acyltransferase family protein n=1 Tax=Brachybacterium phenoliresistens TaxID=396014 RepID=UPI0031D1F143
MTGYPKHLRDPAASPAPAAPAAAAGAGVASTFRPELQGLRAVAILMVVCYHIWFGRVSGGVDIFLLISAFLLTGSFARKLETGSALQIPSYWIHAFKRLLPPSAIVILGSLAGVFLLLPEERWRELIAEAVASGTYWENWLLAFRSVDYYAADHSTASPFQHFWSLSIQGQVFLLWPLLFALAALAAKILRARPRTVMLVLFSAITAASFAWSVHLTATDQTFAYFDTRTRLWEFSLGSVIALVLPSIERRLRYRQADGAQGFAALRAAAGWIGLALILSAGWVIDVEGAFPGYVALWPLLAAALVIIAGPTGTRWGADRLLSSRPLQWLGDISYALYLVHWPLLVFGLVLRDSTHASPKLGTALVAASIVLAWLLTVLVDAPIRTSRSLRASWWRGGLIIVTSLALILGTTTAWTRALDRQEQELLAEAATNNPGAGALAPQYEYQGDASPELLPPPDKRTSDWFALSGTCADHGVPDDLAQYCGFEGDGSGPLLVVAGNSRDEQFAPALFETAKARGWDVMLVVSGGCAFSTGEPVPPDCNAHNQALMSWMLELKPDAFASASTFLPAAEPDAEQPMTGIADLQQPMLDAGIDVIGYRDMPRLPRDPFECHETDGEDCRIDVAEQYLPENPQPQVTVGEGTGRYYSVDAVEEMCPGRVCVPIIGNVFVWMDGSHISAAYARTLAPAVDGQLSAQGWSWG